MCTWWQLYGVFAAIRAARLGARVVIVEKQNAFGGIATNGLVCSWSSLSNTDFTMQIIAGLTSEVLERLTKRKVMRDSGRSLEAKKIYRSQEIKAFNSQELKIELDELVMESGIQPYLHTIFSEPYLDDDNRLKGVIIENKAGREIIKAKYFIDATGDGDLCYRLGLESYSGDLLQPPTTCALFEGWDNDRFHALLKLHGAEFNIPEGYIWGAKVPNTNIQLISGTRVYDVNCVIPEDLTIAEMEGRRQVRAMLDMVRKYGGDFKLELVGLPSTIGIRETRHIKCMYQMSDEDALYGKRFEDAIANCSYRLDMHHQDKPGLTFKYLDGTEVYERIGYEREVGRWREKTEQDPTFYQIPLKSIIPEKYDNLVLAGRMFDAAPIAFSGARVMVNMNQTGEAAGVLSFLALNANKSIKEISHKDVRAKLAEGGSIII